MSENRRRRRYPENRDEVATNTSDNRMFAQVLQTRLARREFLARTGSLAVAGLAGMYFCLPAAADHRRPLTFKELAHGVAETHALAPGYDAQILLRWGDKIFSNSPAWNGVCMNAAAQERQFGYNNDFIAYFPLPLGTDCSDHGLLCVNHEYTDTFFMWPGLESANVFRCMTTEMVAAEMAAHGLSIVEIAKHGNTWRVLRNGTCNRRITATTPMRISGPAAGHVRLRTGGDVTGTRVLGTLNNCSGGKTPWGTVLAAEENFHLYFSGTFSDTAEIGNYDRYGIGRDLKYPWWGRHFPRFDLRREAREVNRFGWIVEVDPYDADFVPVKRTALGRFKHEAATTVVNPDGRVVVYSGDDSSFEYVYRFVTAKAFDRERRAANFDLLDSGTLYVARFDEDGRVKWLPLVFGHGPLTPDNGFKNQGDVLIETRRAADLLGATKMDRPEDIETNPLDGRVYVVLTNNEKRRPDQTTAANPRGPNPFGHILVMTPPGAPGDAVEHAADEFTWDIALLAGNPFDSEHGAHYADGTSRNGWLACPDNLAFDPQGRLWICTDQAKTRERTGICDGVWACDATAAGALAARHFFRAPIGAEVCGPEFTPDGKTLFLAIQHPGTEGKDGATFETPATRWPDFKDHIPPRPSVIAITRRDGRVVGS